MATAEIAAVGAADLAAAAAEPLRADCLRLARKVSLLSHLVAEVAEAGAGSGEWVAELVRALQAARRFVALGRGAPTMGASDQDTICNNIAVQFKYVARQLQAALTNLPHSCFQVSDEVQEAVDVVRAQLKREMEKKGYLDVNLFFSKIHDILARHVDNIGSQSQSPHGQPETSQMENFCNDHLELQSVVLLVSEISGVPKSNMKKISTKLLEGLDNIRVTDSAKPVSVDSQSSDETKGSPGKVKKIDSPDSIYS